MPKSYRTANDHNHSELVERLAALQEACTRIEQWLRILAEPSLAKSLRSIFSDQKQVRAYDLSDGARSTRQIAELIGVGNKTVFSWWHEWEKRGLAEKAGSRGQYRKRYSLGDLQVLHGQFAEDGDAQGTHES